MDLYSSTLSKWLGQLWETFRTAVTPLFLSCVKLLESFAHPSTRWGRISTGGPNWLHESSLGVWSFGNWRFVEVGRLLKIGRLALTEMPSGEWVFFPAAHKCGYSLENASSPPISRERKGSESSWAKPAITIPAASVASFSAACNATYHPENTRCCPTSLHDLYLQWPLHAWRVQSVYSRILSRHHTQQASPSHCPSETTSVPTLLKRSYCSIEPLLSWVSWGEYWRSWCSLKSWCVWLHAGRWAWSQPAGYEARPRVP